MRIKKIAALLLAACLVFLSGCNFGKLIIAEPAATPVDAVATQTEATPTEATTHPPTTEEPTTLKTYDFTGLQYSADSVAVACYDLREERYLYEKNTQMAIAPASLTKIVTACVALKYALPDEVFTVGDEIKLVGSNSSLCFVQVGQQVTLYDLLCGMLLASGNDAAYTVAVNVARKAAGKTMAAQDAVGFFVQLMNEFCAEIGLENSHFVNPEGWDDPQEYMSARDIVTAARYAMQSHVFREIVAKQTCHAVFVSGQTIDWTNSNLMLDAAKPFYTEGVEGIKTGTTEFAAKCLAAYYRDGEHELIVVSMGNATDEQRYYSVREIIDTVKSQSAQ
ncbi:MAG: D-alanyl-D-alanine carboxypeptidase [Clostridia bacterium]|nr:D-alanyl-D-alanine carboxypeptidase [Clostridia bacterium]